MGQMVLIDEDKLNTIKNSAYWGEYLCRRIKLLQEELYPEYVCVDPLSNGQVCGIILEDMKQEIDNYRNSPWKKIIGGR